MYRVLISIFGLIFFISCSNIHEISPKEMIRDFMNEEKVPGLFVAVVKNDSIIYKDSFGWADKEKKIPITSNTCMELGSISKAFTAWAIYDLHKKGLLGLLDNLKKFFPDAPASWEQITIKDLLAHTSGIQNYLLDPRFRAGDYFGGTTDPEIEKFLKNLDVDSMVKMFYELPVEFQPGESWSYSNTGYILLGKIVESVASRPFFEYVEENFLKPGGMAQTKANELASGENCLAKGYFPSGDSVKIAPVLTSNYAFSAGAWASTGNDMIRYIQSIHRKSGPDELRVAPNLSGQLPFTYEGGRFYSDYHGMKIISHGGGTPGFTSSWIYNTDKNISIIILTNRQDYSALDQLAWNALSFYEPSMKYPEKKLDDEDGEKLSRVLEGFTGAIKNNGPYPKEFSKPLKIFLETENGKGFWKWFFERGFPDSAFCVDKEVIENGKLFRFRLPLNNNKIEYRLTLLVNEANEIVQVRWW